MAFKKTLVQRLFNITKISNQSLTNGRMCSLISTRGQSLISSNPDRIAPDPGDVSIFRRFLHLPPVYQSLPTGETLLEKLRGMDITKDRIQLDGLLPPVMKETENLTVEDVRKLLRVSQLETVKSTLREMKQNYISHEELVKICVDSCSNVELGLEFAKMLDESGSVIALGNVVFLRPDQVVKAIHGLIMPVNQPDPNDPRMMELKEMEVKKSAIDKKAESLVRRELWLGLGYLVVQTTGFMRLTFWELTWDVMEPICFYVTSMYFMAGYTFFLRTSKEPSFEGFFQSRFSAKQKKLMKVQGFDLGRYNELKKICYPNQSAKKDDKHAFS